MIDYFKTINGVLTPLEESEPGCWIRLVAPTEQETDMLIEKYHVDPGYIRAALDEEESSHIDKEEQDTLIILDVPVMQKNEKEKNVTYLTVPIGIIIQPDYIITIMSSQHAIFDDFISGRIRDLNTEYKTKFVLQIMLKTATRFLQMLKQIDKFSTHIEGELRKSMKNKELIQLLELEKSLVYFNTSLKSDEMTVKKLAGGRFVKLYDEDRDLLEDVLVELNQAQEMASIHLNILSGTMDAFASVISNNLNIVMKMLASVTIVISIPTIIASFYGMNVDHVPVPYFWFPVCVALLMMGAVGFILYKKNMF